MLLGKTVEIRELKTLLKKTRTGKYTAILFIEKQGRVIEKYNGVVSWKKKPIL